MHRGRQKQKHVSCNVEDLGEMFRLADLVVVWDDLPSTMCCTDMPGIVPEHLAMRGGLMTMMTTILLFILFMPIASYCILLHHSDTF